ncbi:caspase family protein [Microcoleus sp. herbarium2]|uniref:caspase family protein n=1 Tax=Microcoleus sp. herbarium2 TaxID=3055433 RepID=UPI002FD38318
MSWQKNYFALATDNLNIRYNDAIKKLDVPFYILRDNVGRAFLEKSAFQQTIAALKNSLSQAKSTDPALLLELGTFQSKERLYAYSYKIFQQYITITCSTQLQKVILQIQDIQDHRFSTRYALLIGIKNHLNNDIKPAKKAINDVLLLRNILLNSCDFKSNNIKVLLYGNATCQNILNKFKNLAEKSYENPALFYFAGQGSWHSDNSDNLTILGVDSRQPDVFDIELKELSKIVTNCPTNLVTIVDATWSTSTLKKKYSPRSVLPAQSPLPSKRSMRLKQSKERKSQLLSNTCLQIGCISIYTNSIRHEIYNGVGVEADYENDFQNFIHGVLTYNLTKSLSKNKIGTLTYNQLIKSISSEAQPFVVETHLDARLFDNSVCCSLINELLRKVKQAPVEQRISFFKRLIEQRNSIDPESHLNLGIADYTLGDYGKSIASIETALNQVSEQNVELKRKRLAFPEAHYWLGRVLYESKRDPAYAVKELRLATQGMF